MDSSIAFRDKYLCAVAYTGERHDSLCRAEGTGGKRIGAVCTMAICIVMASRIKTTLFDTQVAYDKQAHAAVIFCIGEGVLYANAR